MVALLNTIYYSMLYGFLFLMAVSIGSFLNVVIYRLPNGISVAQGRSFCPACNTQIKERDLIPILSYLLLGGKCRSCHQKISPRYLLVELASGLVAMFLYWYHGELAATLCSFALFCLLLCVTMIDIDTMTIPDSLIIALAVLAGVSVFVLGDVSLLSRGIGFFIVSVPMFLLCLVVQDAFGGGDIKLMAVCGFLLGWRHIVLAMLLGCVLGGVFAAYLLANKKAKKEAHICFGPFLSVGILAASLFGTQMLAWYFGLF